MSQGKLLSFTWTDKTALKKSRLYIAGLALGILFVVIRLKPYFGKQEVTKPYVRDRDAHKAQTATGDGKSKPDITGRDHGSNVHSYSTVATNNNHPVSHLIERPLFDGLTVKIKAVILQNISSSQNDLTVDSELVGCDDSGVDLTGLENAHLTGIGRPNLDSKHFEIQFSELITSTGKRYALVGYAIDDHDHALGVPAQYSSNLGSRIAGQTLGRGIQVGEEILTQKAFQSTGTQDQATDTFNRSLSDSSNQATTGLSDELTKDLKNKRPELFLPAGTVFTIKLHAIEGKNGVQK